MRSSVSDRASVERPSRRSSCNSNVLRRSHTRVLTHIHTHTRSAWDRGSARTEGGKSDSCGCEHSAAYRTSTHTHAHTRFGIIYCAREIINVHIIYCVFLSFFMCSSLMILFMLIYFFMVLILVAGNLVLGLQTDKTVY